MKEAATINHTFLKPAFMKKIFIIISFLSAHLFHLYAQPVLYGLTHGDINTGTISKFDVSANSLSAVHTFRDIGIYPPGRFIRTSDGKLYGMTNNGGTNNRGVIFYFDPSTSIYTKLKDFDNTDGSYPQGSLMQATDGKLYGMTSSGGTDNYGVIFSFDPSTSIYTS
jgi:uncharacterized repeat protein (TIGR03803 family)